MKGIYNLYSNNDVEEIAKRCGFEFLGWEEVEEIEGKAFILKHKLSHARLLFLNNEDINKSFSISFKTPPKDSTGVFHILEHSVLCGSDKYPVKEPFVNLLKSSMQTFLNAMTFPDKTVYPVASTNEQDLINLMNVYLDAVFNPRIYNSKEIFEQEGWHKEVDDDGNLIFSGVVLNEMRGALSDPDSVLFDTICEQLYPSSCYAFESGGHPSKIPNLTYEDFLDHHKRHYNPNNSYIILYGNLNLEVFLEIINNDYLIPALQKYDVEQDQINNFRLSDKANPEIRTVNMPISQTSTCAALAYKIGKSDNLIESQALDLVMESLMGSNEAPLKKKLLECKIADEFYVSEIEPVAEPAMMICMQGIKVDDAFPKFEKAFRQELAKLVQNGFDKKLIEASINHAEILMREHNFGVADGVTYSLDAMSSWLYDDNCPTDYLKYSSIFQKLRELLESDYYENLVNKLILENNEVARAEIVPIKDSFAKEEKIQLSENEKESIINNANHLKEVQSTPDSEENVARLPFMSIANIDKTPKSINWLEDKWKGQTVIFHRDLITSGINYYNLYFDFSCLSWEELSYLSILVLLLGKVDTIDKGANEIEVDAKLHLGALNFSIYCSSKSGLDNPKPYLRVKASCLDGNDKYINNLLSSIIYKTKFDDLAKIKSILLQTKIATEQSLINSGHIFATRRANASLSKLGALIEKISGIDFYLFLTDLCNNFDHDYEDLIENIKNVFNKINKISPIISTSANMQDLNNAFGDLYFSQDVLGDRLQIVLNDKDREAFAINSDVTFTSVRNILINRDKQIDYDGTWNIASRAISYDYLWNTIRVQGGAYGCGFSVTDDGQCGFYTYRDPNVASSIKTISNTYKWMKTFQPSKTEFDGYVISTIAKYDEPKKAPAQIALGDSQFFSGKDDLIRVMHREQALYAKVDDLHNKIDALQNITSTGKICVVGNKDSLKNLQNFNNIICL